MFAVVSAKNAFPNVKNIYMIFVGELCIVQPQKASLPVSDPNI